MNPWVLLLLSACSSSSTGPAPPPPTTYFYPGAHGTPIPESPAASATAPAEGPPLPQTVGQALAPFGIIILPEYDFQLPTLEQLQRGEVQWGNIPWPFLGVQPPPGSPTPAPTVPPSSTPAPTPFPTAPSPVPPVATPTPGAPAPGSSVFAGWKPEEVRVLELVNEHRARGGTCGRMAMRPVPALAPQAALRQAAHAHSQDMATRGYFDHFSPEGTSPMQRTRAAGYPGSSVGENIAAGGPTPERAVEQWLNSEGHCLNLMSPGYTHLGVGYAHTPNDKLKHYWTQVFGG